MKTSALAENIARMRAERGMTQAELAEKLNFTYQTVSSWERGKSAPDAETIVALSEVFSVTADELLKPQKKRAAEKRVLKPVSGYYEAPVKTVAALKILLIITAVCAFAAALTYTIALCLKNSVSVFTATYVYIIFTGLAEALIIADYVLFIISKKHSGKPVFIILAAVSFAAMLAFGAMAIFSVAVSPDFSFEVKKPFALYMALYAFCGAAFQIFFSLFFRVHAERKKDIYRVYIALIIFYALSAAIIPSVPIYSAFMIAAFFYLYFNTENKTRPVFYKGYRPEIDITLPPVKEEISNPPVNKELYRRLKNGQSNFTSPDIQISLFIILITVTVGLIFSNNRILTTAILSLMPVICIEVFFLSIKGCKFKAINVLFCSITCVSHALCAFIYVYENIPAVCFVLLILCNLTGAFFVAIFCERKTNKLIDVLIIAPLIAFALFLIIYTLINYAVIQTYRIVSIYYIFAELICYALFTITKMPRKMN